MTVIGLKNKLCGAQSYEAVPKRCLGCGWVSWDGAKGRVKFGLGGFLWLGREDEARFRPRRKWWVVGPFMKVCLSAIARKPLVKFGEWYSMGVLWGIWLVITGPGGRSCKVCGGGRCNGEEFGDRFR